MSLVSFRNADIVGDRFLTLLSKHGIQPPLGSSFEDELLSLTQLIEVAKNPNLARGTKAVPVLRAAAGVHDFAAKILSVEPLPEFPNFLPHLRLIANAKMPSASFSQNSASTYGDDTARKMAELYIGCLAANIGDQVELDHPTGAKGDNPDVIFTFTPTMAGVAQPVQKWALAIKTISSKQGQTIFERIKGGAEQIDDEKCAADKGLVIINAKDALDHDALWNANFDNLDEAQNVLREQLEHLAVLASDNRPQEDWNAIFANKTERPVLFLGQSLVRLPPEVPTPLKMFYAHPAGGPIENTASVLAAGLNDMMQKILLGIPGGPHDLAR
jgi:hypothetical protein